MNYSAMSEAKHRECSKLLSNTRPTPAPTPAPVSNNSDQSTDTSSRASTTPSPQDHENQSTDHASPYTDTNTDNTVSMPDFNDGTEYGQQQNKTHLPHPLQSRSMSESLSLNTQLNSLFSGAVVNIQNFNLNMQ